MEFGDWEIRDSEFHEHPLMLTKEKELIMPCNACCVYLKGPIYECSSCVFKVHKSCGKLPRKFQNPYHSHPLTLVAGGRKGHSFKCFACHKYLFGFSFQCGECRFDLSIKCALWKLTADEGQEQLHHLTHLHPLVATEKKKHDNGDDVLCKICEEPCSDELYGCDNCNFYLHRSCAKLQLPPTLQHFYHPCLLTLCFDKEGSNCKACGNFYDFYSYLCEPCNFRMDISCALLPIIMESLGQRQFHHFSHGHPLKLAEINDDDDEILCSACQKHCLGQTYVCCSRKCRFFLHDLCFNLPQNIHHPVHPTHLLTLYSPIQRQSRSKCKICHRFCSGFTYSCNCCKFDVDVECPVIISTIRYQGHHHNILFVHGLDPCQPDSDDDIPRQPEANDDASSSSMATIVLMCNACGTSCNCLKAMFHCMECDFHLHFKCGPLPCFIKDKENHPCPLKLIDSPVDIEGECKDTDVFYCDVCEKERDPRLPVYYCSEGCSYLAEIKCMISEVLLSLNGEYGEVELRSAIFKYKSGKVICKGIELAWQACVADNDTAETGKLVVDPSFIMDDTLDALAKMEDNQIRTDFVCALYKDKVITDIGDFSCSDADFKKFMAVMDTCDNLTILTDRWKNNKKVAIGNRIYTVSSDLASILEDLCAKYEDIVPEVFQLPGVRTFLNNTLCETIRSMCTTRVADISEAKLFSWWRCLRTLQYKQYQVGFAMDRFKRVAKAYYALQVKKTAEKDREQTDREIEEVSRHIKELEAKLMALKEKRKTREPPKPASSSIVAECFEEVSVLKWKIAGEGLL